MGVIEGVIFSWEERLGDDIVKRCGYSLRCEQSGTNQSSYLKEGEFETHDEGGLGMEEEKEREKCGDFRRESFLCCLSTFRKKKMGEREERSKLL